MVGEQISASVLNAQLFCFAQSAVDAETNLISIAIVCVSRALFCIGAGAHLSVHRREPRARMARRCRRREGRGELRPHHPTPGTPL